MTKLQIQYIHPKELSLYTKNPRKISPENLEKLENSITNYGFTNPILVWKNNGKLEVLAGHQRIQASLKLKLEKIPVIVLPFSDEKKARAYNIIDNKSAEWSEWDFPQLAEIINELDALNYNLDSTGFDMKEIENIMTYTPSFSSAVEIDEETMERELRSPFGYIGGKYILAPWIVNYFSYDIKTYVELFGGAGHVLFAKKPHQIEIFNDIDDNIINFFLQLKEKKQELFETLDKLPYSRKIYETWNKEYKENKFKKLENFERAVRWFYLIRGVFAGTIGRGWGYGFTRSIVKTYYSSLQLFDLIHKRIQNVQFECRDFKDILGTIHSRPKEVQKNMLIYADPPYYGKEYWYEHKFTIEDHKTLAEKLNNLSCQIIVSYYSSDEIRKLYPEPKWKYKYKQSTKHSQKKIKESKSRSLEVLIMNFKKEKENENEDDDIVINE